MSCSAASWRILAEGVISGLGGCRIASWPGVFITRKALPWSPGTISRVRSSISARNSSRCTARSRIKAAVSVRLPSAAGCRRSHPVSLAGLVRQNAGLDLPPGVAAAQFGVGGDGQAPGSFGGVLPFLPGGYVLGEVVFSLPVVVAEGPVAGGQVLVPGGAVILAGLAGSGCLGVGADGGQGGVEGAEPGQPQLLPGIRGRPGGLPRVGVAGQPQLPVGQGPDIRLACRAEGGESLVPRGPLIRCFPGRLGTDRVIGMVVAVHLPVRGDRGGLVFPLPAGGGAGGDRAEDADHPGRRGLGGVLAQAPGAVV